MEGFTSSVLLSLADTSARYVVVRLCFGNKREYLGRVRTLDDFNQYRNNCGSDPRDIVIL